MSGGDAAALAEVRIALGHVITQENPDLANTLLLACHRDDLTELNSAIPVNLPAVWALLGQMPRALALAESITELGKHVVDQGHIALSYMKLVLSEAGQHEQAEAITQLLPPGWGTIPRLTGRIEEAVGGADSAG